MSWPWSVLVLVIVLAGSFAGAGPGEATTAVFDTTPRGVHLSLTEDATTTMTVTWFTDAQADTVVAYGPAALDQTQVGVSFEAAPAGSGVHVHEVHLDDLHPGTTYQYRVGGSGGWSPTYTFRTDDGDGAFRLAVLGDHGTDDLGDPPAFWQSQRTTETILASLPDLVVIAGDLSYANGDAPVWDVWFDQLEPLAARVPVMTAIGNHEWEGTLGTAAFRTRLAMPDAELYFAFDYGRAHFLVLQSHLDGLVGDKILADMVAFAEADLEQAAARREAGAIDLVFVVQHHPLYSNSDMPERRLVPHLVALEEQWFARYGVDVLLVGHDHYYDRSRPMVFGQPTTLESWDYTDPVGTIMVVTGGAGRSLYDFGSEILFYPWSAAHAKKHHFVQLDVDGGRIEAQAVSTGLGSQGDVFDAWTLTRTRNAHAASGAPWPLPAGLAQG